VDDAQPLGEPVRYDCCAQSHVMSDLSTMTGSYGALEGITDVSQRCRLLPRVSGTDSLSATRPTLSGPSFTRVLVPAIKGRGHST
jgi:hypothetical protein